MKLEQPILEVLQRINQHGEAIVYGGYLRDKYIGKKPNDIDIATNLDMEMVMTIFPNITGSEKGLAFGVGRFVYKSLHFEISCHPNENLLDYLSQRDFKINSLYHDGSQLFDPFNAIPDFENKILTPTESIYDLSKTPQVLLRSIRLASDLGFSIHDLALSEIKKQLELISLNSEGRFQSEGFRILTGEFPLNGFYYLNEFGLLSTDQNIERFISLPYQNEPMHIRLVLLSIYLSPKTLTDYTKLFLLSDKLLEQAKNLLPYVNNEELPLNPKLLNEVITVKRLQYRNNPQKLQEYLNGIKKRIQ